MVLIEVYLIELRAQVKKICISSEGGLCVRTDLSNNWNENGMVWCVPVRSVFVLANCNGRARQIHQERLL